MGDADINRQKVKSFGELLIFLHRDHANWAKEPKRSKEQRLNREVTEKTVYQIVNIGKLTSTTQAMEKKGEPCALDTKNLLFLKPPHDQLLLPALSLAVDFRKSELKVHMALFTYNEKQKLSAIGFRFETPEEKGERHAYHHAQLIRSFERNTPPLFPGLPKWLPDTLPVFPLSARSPFSLFLGILIGLYGLDYLSKEWNGQKFFDALKEDVLVFKSGCGYR